MTVTVLQAEARTPNSSPRHRPHCALLIAIVVMGAIAVFSLTEHLFIDNLPTAELFSGRWPLVLAAASAGAMLALAGTIMQSVTANPLASPEGLRVSASAAPRRSRTWLLSLAALLTAAATLIVGPHELCRTDRAPYRGDDHASKAAEPGLVCGRRRGGLDDRG